MPLLEVTPKSTKIRKWGGSIYVYDPTQHRYRPVTGVAQRRGILGRLKALWRRVRMEEAR